MRLMISVLVAIALVLCLGCAKQETAPAEPEAASTQAPQTDADPIASEDFESGEIDGAMEAADVEEEAQEETAEDSN